MTAGGDEAICASVSMTEQAAWAGAHTAFTPFQDG